jgi:hypothetical protein
MDAQRFATDRRSTPVLDYESFTDSWFSADTNAGGRIPRLRARCADYEHGDRTMIDFDELRR